MPKIGRRGLLAGAASLAGFAPIASLAQTVPAIPVLKDPMAAGEIGSDQAHGRRGRLFVVVVDRLARVVQDHFARKVTL